MGFAGVCSVASFVHLEVTMVSRHSYLIRPIGLGVVGIQHKRGREALTLVFCSLPSFFALPSLTLYIFILSCICFWSSRTDGVFIVYV